MSEKCTTFSWAYVNSVVSVFGDLATLARMHLLAKLKPTRTTSNCGKNVCSV